MRSAALAALFCAAVVTSGCGSSNGSSPPPPSPSPPTPPAGPLAFGPITTVAANPAVVFAPAAAIDAAGVAVVMWGQTGLVPVAGQPPLASPYVAARENTASGGWAATVVAESTTQAGDGATDQIVGLQALAPATGIAGAWLRAAAAGDRARSALREAPSGWSSSNIAAPAVAGVARSALVFAANDAGTQAVAWIEPVNNVPQVQLRVRRLGAGGFDWTAPAAPVQTSPSQAGSDPALAMDSAGRVMIVWRQVANASVGELRSRTYDVIGATYSNELPVQPNQPDMRKPRVAAVGPNQFIAVWEQASGNIYDLRGRAGNASNWIGISSIVIDRRVEDVSAAELLAGPNQTALVVWQQADTLFASRWAGATGTWTVPVQVGAGLAGVARDLRVAGDATGRAVAVWSQAGTSGIKDLYYALVSGATPDVTASTLLEVDSAATAAPSVAMNATGAAVVTWLQSVSGQPQPDVVARVAR